MIVGEFKDNLAGLLHGTNLDDITSLDLCLERAANSLLSRIDPIDTVRAVPLTSTIHDNIYNYALPSDFNKIIDLYPQDNRNAGDVVTRQMAMSFDLRKAFASQTASIESDNGSKFLRLNWRSRQGKVLHQMNDFDDNGTWTAVGTASGIQQDTITKYSGSGSVRFDLAASGDGIQNIAMTAVDLTDEDEVADAFIPFYIKNSTDLARLTSATFRFGNDLTTNYWTGVAQTTQADGTAFKVGWNVIKIPWSTATETGTVAPATIDSAKLTFATTGAITDIRVDNIIFSIGRNFDLKYYSKYLLKNSAGTWLTKSTDDSDIIVLDNDAIQCYMLEALIALTQQIENNAFDVTWAKQELLGPDLSDRRGLYARYRKEHPSQAIKTVMAYGSNPARGRW